uniref:CS domain-containing protein n=1 Tax=Caenorhabditis japonica TaxID=281687 RepID=A0A8R1DUR2_CAEJA
MAKQPQVTWAQREELLYLTIEVDEAKIEQLKGEGNKLNFQGSSKTDKYETTLEFFDDIDPESVQRIGSSTRVVELVIKKKAAAWWPRLLNVKGKVHWLKVDFSKWKDEDDEEEVEEPAVGGGLGNGFDLNQYMSTLGGAGGGEDFGGLDDEDDEMPDLEDNDEEEENKDEVKA